MLLIMAIPTAFSLFFPRLNQALLLPVGQFLSQAKASFHQPCMMETVCNHNNVQGVCKICKY